MYIKEILQKVKNVLWLIKPYLKYGPWLLVIDILYKAVCWPLLSYLQVYIPQFTINALTENKGILYILFIIASFTGLNFLLKCVENYVFDRYDAVKNPKVKMQIQKEIYEKTRFMDYKYMDNPEFYDEYSWLINNYADKSDEARDIINSILRGIVAVVLFSTLIATISPWVVLVVAAYGVLRVVFNIYNNKIEVAKEEALVPYDRKLDYVHRLHYQKEYGADMRTTNLYSKASHIYDTNAQNKLGLLNKLTKKIFALGTLQSLVYMVSRAIILFCIAVAYWDGSLANIGMFATMWMAADKLDDYLYDIFDIVMTAKNGLVLLDEPSSALDPIAEYEMNEVLLEQCAQSTTVMIAHRLSSVRDLDRIFVIGNGVVLEEGTHSELMAQHGKYYDMFTKQANKYMETE